MPPEFPHFRADEGYFTVQTRSCPQESIQIHNLRATVVAINPKHYITGGNDPNALVYKALRYFLPPFANYPGWHAFVAIQHRRAYKPGLIAGAGLIRKSDCFVCRIAAR